MKAEIINIGSELLLGQIANTNAQYISEQLAKIGIDVYYHTVIGDNKDRLLEMLKIASKRSDIIITTGGLGPTMDDLTKETIAEFLRLDMVLDKVSLDKIEHYFQKTKRDMPNKNIKQALFPKDAKILPNQFGTAPGAIIEDKNNTYIMLPGPPHELIYMFDTYVYPYLKKYSNHIIYSRVLKVCGMGESTVEEKIKDLLTEQDNPTIALLATQGEVLIRLTAKVEKNIDPGKFIYPIEHEIKKRLGDFIYGIDNQTLEEVLIKRLIEKNKTIAVAESCTGGLISNLLTNIPNASQAFIEGFITYSNEAKIKRLGVNPSTLKKWGAVSKKTAAEMAKGVLNTTNADIAIAVTGIAGPGGATSTKPVGLVYIAVGSGEQINVDECHFTGDRLRIKNLTAKTALDKARRYLNFI
ncbi:MAG TPA: competence/damage-inducible protein A [Clostridiales bacterium]|nr:competence/damage-inducible protein A [Clostridiales bacterium]